MQQGPNQPQQSFEQYQQQPYQQQPQYTPPPMMQQQPPAPKKPRRWPWIVAIIVALIIGYASGSASHSGGDTNANTSTSNNTTAKTTTVAQTSTKPTQQPAASTPKWTTTHTFKGSGTKKTATFAVGNDWKISWKCDPNSFMGSQYNLMVAVTNSDNTPADPGAINELCKKGNASGETEEHQGGNVYLDINSEADWTITISELK